MVGAEVSSEDAPVGFVPTQDDFNAGLRMLGGEKHTAEVDGQIVSGKVVRGMFVPDAEHRQALSDAAHEARKLVDASEAAA